MTKRTFLFLTLITVGFASCELPDIGVAYDPTNGGNPVVDLNEIKGEWNFGKIEVVTDNGKLYSIEGQELVNVFANQGLQSTSNVQRFLRNKMVFEAQSVKAYTISQTTPFQGSWQYVPEDGKLVLFADAKDSEAYTIKGLSKEFLAISMSKVNLTEIPLSTEQQTFEQVIAQQIGKKIINVKEMNKDVADKVQSIQLIIRYQR
ncbi:MAG: hypothetical protein ACI9V1_002821 [Spirosomataceae bacterium]|jgi:hypothetical protein